MFMMSYKRTVDLLLYDYHIDLIYDAYKTY